MCCTQYANKFGKLSSGHRNGKGVFIPFPKKGNPKNAQTTTQLHSSHMLVKQCSNFSQARLQQYVNRELPDVQVGFRKDRGTRDQISNICWIIEKAREFQKTSTFALLITPKSLTVGNTTNGKILKEMQIPDHLPCLLRCLCEGQEAKVRAGHGTTD